MEDQTEEQIEEREDKIPHSQSIETVRALLESRHRLAAVAISALSMMCIMAFIAAGLLFWQTYRDKNAFERATHAEKTAVQAKQLAKVQQQERLQSCRDQNSRHTRTAAYVRSVFSVPLKSATTKSQRDALLSERSAYEQVVQDLAPYKNCAKATASK